MIEWRDQIPVIQEYHSLLIKVIQVIIIMKKDNNIKFNAFIIIINELLSIWPQGYDTNTPKEILLLHEIEKLLEVCSIDDFKIINVQLIDRICKSVGSETDNIRTMQRTLQMFKNDKILNIIKSDQDIKRFAISKLLPALYREGVLTWNPTVNKMTGLALKKLREMDEEIFMQSAENIEQSKIPAKKTSKTDECSLDAYSKEDGNESLPKKFRSSVNTIVSPAVKSNDFSKPLLPPRPINSIPRPMQKTDDFKSITTAWKPGSGPPPVTITGVAPWALGSQTKASTPLLGVHAVFPKNDSKNFQIENFREQKSEEVETSGNGINLIMEYIENCLPKGSDDGSEGSKEWNKLQSAPTPTLLPSMRFHDLVFGKNLGSGSFSSVRYGRQIVREKSRDHWPEFAVKIISTSTIIEKNYYLPTIREIAILQLLSHPGIARLISSFQYNNSVYLVLEYAARGDLHSYLLKMAPLTHLQTRFVVGEVASAIISIHELGFSYNDLKPENLLITEQGHVKVADFGACRPITTEAIQILKESKNILVNLRNGDWRDVNPDKIVSSDGVDVSILNEDIRFEGTPAYLPPEVLLNKVSSFSTSVDAWALGCLTSFCLKGRPPFYGDAQQVISQIFECKKGKVNFILDEMDDEDKEQDMVLLDECAQKFISSLICVDVDTRLRFTDIINHDYLICGRVSSEITSSEHTLKLNPKKLHFQDPIDLPVLCDDDKEKEGQDKEWARRQLSVLWAPMPSDKSLLDSSNDVGDDIPATYIFDTIIETNIESNTHFS